MKKILVALVIIAVLISSLSAGLVKKPFLSTIDKALLSHNIGDIWVEEASFAFYTIEDGKMNAWCENRTALNILSNGTEGSDFPHELVVILEDFAWNYLCETSSSIAESAYSSVTGEKYVIVSVIIENDDIELLEYAVKNVFPKLLMK